MEQWKPWENLELLKTAYCEPEEVKEKEKYECSVADINGIAPTDNEPGRLWGYRLRNWDDR
jgi:hypothetical protein